MEDVLANLAYGFSVALTPTNLILVAVGGLFGTIMGMLPGIGPATGIAVLLPMTFSMNPASALITMCGIYYGAMYGGSRSSILINTPGDGAAIAATFDGYPMAQKGEAGPALAISAIASFIGGIIAVVVMTLLAVPVARFALKFGPAEYFSLMVFALSATAAISKGNLIKGLISMLLGLMISTVGIDLQSGVPRFTFGVLELQTGIDFLVVIIGMYALGEVFKFYESIDVSSKLRTTKFGRIWVTREQWRRCVLPILRSAPVGFLIGVLPGAGGTMASMVAYNNEKQLAKEPERFGKGAIEGLAAPEAANNAASVGALIPMLTLGVPGSGTTAIMMGALMMLGLKPGPLLFQNNADVAWGVISSMYVGNIILAIINIPLAGLLVKILAVPPKILYPIILGLAFVGTYTLNYSIVDFYLLLLFGLVGYFMKKLKIPTAPLILAAIVGGSMEQSFRQALTLSDGSLKIFVSSTISIVLLILAALSIAYPFVIDLMKKKKNVSASE